MSGALRRPCIHWPMRTLYNPCGADVYTVYVHGLFVIDRQRAILRSLNREELLLGLACLSRSSDLRHHVLLGMQFLSQRVCKYYTDVLFTTC